MSDTPATPKLPDLAKSRFGPISPAEQKLFEAAADGNDADCTSLSQSDRIIHDRDFEAEGGVNLTAAKIEGGLDCSGGHFVGKCSVPALSANNAKIGASVYLQKDIKAGKHFKAVGLVDFRKATIGGELECYGGQFVSRGEALALNAD